MSEKNGKTIPQDGDDEKKKYLELEKAGIFKRFQNVTFENIEKRGLPESNNIKKNYYLAKEFAATLDFQIKNGYGLIMAGRYGTLKTTIAVAILRKWIDDGHHGMLVPMCSLIDNLFTLRATNLEEWAGYERKLRTTPLLILDDLGGEDTEKSWVKSKIDSIITERYNKMLSVIVTTNLTKEDLTGTYSERVMDRLKNTARYLSFDEQSQRRVMQ